MEQKYRKYINNIIEKVQSLEHTVGEMLSAMESDGLEVDDAVFDMINDLKDGCDDIDYALNTIIPD